MGKARLPPALLVTMVQLVVMMGEAMAGLGGEAGVREALRMGVRGMASVGFMGQGRLAATDGLGIRSELDT